MRINDTYPPEGPSGLKAFAARLVFYAMMAVLLAVLAVVVTLGVANAQEVASGTVIDAGPFAAGLIDLAFMILGPPIGVAVLAVLAKFYALIGLQKEKLDRSAVEQALEKAAAYARTRLADRMIGGIPIDARSEAIAVAAGYAMRSIPDTLKKIGITDVASARLAEMVETRLEDWLIDPEAERGDSVAIRRLAGPFRLA